jgi:DNA modification methylase
MTAALIRDDAFAVMQRMAGSSVDHVITDPPYDASTHAGAVHYTAAQQIAAGDAGVHTFDAITADQVTTLVDQWLRICTGWIIVFCTLEQIGVYKSAAQRHDAWVRAGYWDKQTHTPQWSGDRPAQPGEGIAIMHRPGRKTWNGGGRAAIWRARVEHGQKKHPTAKPLALMRKLVIDFTQPYDLVFDPFAGSGTTGVACIQTGRQFSGIEQDRTYYEIARTRLANTQTPLMVPDAPAMTQDRMI